MASRSGAPLKPICTICFDDINFVERNDENRPVTAVGCGHVYHMKCILTWINDNPVCPQCMVQLNDTNLQRLLVEMETSSSSDASRDYAAAAIAARRGPQGDNARETSGDSTASPGPEPTTTTSAASILAARREIEARENEARENEAREIEEREIEAEDRASEMLTLRAHIRTLEKRVKEVEDENQTLNMLLNESNAQQNPGGISTGDGGSVRASASTPYISPTSSSTHGSTTSPTNYHSRYHHQYAGPAMSHYHYPQHHHGYGVPSSGPTFPYMPGTRRARPAGISDNSFYMSHSEDPSWFPNFSSALSSVPQQPRRRFGPHNMPGMASFWTPRPSTPADPSSSIAEERMREARGSPQSHAGGRPRSSSRSPPDASSDSPNGTSTAAGPSATSPPTSGASSQTGTTISQVPSSTTNPAASLVNVDSRFSSSEIDGAYGTSFGAPYGHPSNGFDQGESDSAAQGTIQSWLQMPVQSVHDPSTPASQPEQQQDEQQPQQPNQWQYPGDYHQPPPQCRQQ